MQAKFSLDPSIDAAALAAAFERDGRVSIEPFLAPGQAELLAENLRKRGDWRRILNSGPEKVFEFDRRTQKSLTPEQCASLDDAVYAGARRDFQYRYETVRVPDDAPGRAGSDDPVVQYASFISSGPARDLLRQVCGDEHIAFADAQGTAYAPGDFLTSHDDDVEGKNRSAAHVLSLNPEWRAEWGGLFLMHDEDGAHADAILPGFNRLNLFRVPQMHSVSEVTRASPYRRYSITGWLRR